MNTIHLVLEETARHLTGRDLSILAGMAEQAQAEILIRYDSWQVMVGAPEKSFPGISEALRAMGHPFHIQSGKKEGLPGFVLKRECDAAPI